MADEGEIEKVVTGIPGFDRVAEGGLPRGRGTLVTGTSGAGKSIFAAQFLAGAIRQVTDQHGGILGGVEV